MSFEVPLPFQVELAAISGFCTQCDLAKQFILFLLTPEIQQLLHKENYMLSIIENSPIDSFSQYISRLKTSFLYRIGKIFKAKNKMA